MAYTQYLTIPELARMLGISRIAVYKRVKKGKIKAIRVGRNFAISRDAVKKIEKNGNEENDESKV